VAQSSGVALVRRCFMMHDRLVRQPGLDYELKSNQFGHARLQEQIKMCALARRAADFRDLILRTRRTL
jgi:hypothetical protein